MQWWSLRERVLHMVFTIWKLTTISHHISKTVSLIMRAIDFNLEYYRSLVAPRLGCRDQ